MYQAKILLDSINGAGNRLTTFEITYPRFIHSEFMTHRLFSRNAASSRAIPNAKLIERIIEDPVMPVYWGKNRAGMQATEVVEDVGDAESVWLDARNSMLRYSAKLSEKGVHKQLANRILEPWMYITTIVTATEYQNFFDLRCDVAAQPEIKKIADLMRDALEASCPTPLQPGDWHTPFIREQEVDYPMVQLLKLSVARCARVSYLTHDGVRDEKKDYELHDRLLESGHWSCFEHQAQALLDSEQSANFNGWQQYRKVLEAQQEEEK